MRVKLGQIVASQGSLAKLLGGATADGQVVPAPNVSAQMGWHLHLLRKVVIEQIQYFEAEREKIAHEVDPQKPETLIEADKRLEELLSVEVVLAAVGRIKLSVLEKESILLSANDFSALEWLIKPDLPSIFEAEEE